MISKFNSQTGEILDYPIRSVFQTFFPDYESANFVSVQQRKAASCICRCKTGALGYSVSECPDCDYKRIAQTVRLPWKRNGSWNAMRN